MQMDMAPHTHDGDPPVRTFAKGAAQYVHKLWHAAVHTRRLRVERARPTDLAGRPIPQSAPDDAGWSANSAPSLLWSDLLDLLVRVRGALAVLTDRPADGAHQSGCRLYTIILCHRRHRRPLPRCPRLRRHRRAERASSCHNSLSTLIQSRTTTTWGAKSTMRHA